jgi:hypothetical protein
MTGTVYACHSFSPTMRHQERKIMSDPNEPVSGGIPYAVGMPSVVRIPIPNTNGLCIEFRSRGFVPRGHSTSTLFFQDVSGKRHLRLDYGYTSELKPLISIGTKPARMQTSVSPIILQ